MINLDGLGIKETERRLITYTMMKLNWMMLVESKDEINAIITKLSKQEVKE